MPDESRVFDVTRPSHVNPSATSRPVIVGHHPQTADPMVKEGVGSSTEPKAPESTRIAFTDASPAAPAISGTNEPVIPAAFTVPEPLDRHDEPANFFNPPESAQKPAETTDAPAVFGTPEPDSEPMTGAAPVPTDSAFTPVGPEPQSEPPTEPSTEPAADTIQPSPAIEQSQPHIEGLRFNQPKQGHRWMKFSILAILVLLIAGYLAIDSGAIGSGINLPFHVFKQKSANPSPAASSTNKPAASTAPSVPAGFKEYKLSGTSLTFAAPATWGDPTSTSESGYSKRGTNIQADGTYAYIVDFATNKNVEIAVTSNKFLPPIRSGGAILYYDFLQWCTGTNDGKFYESILHFTTANKIDTPTTITCDQGPLNNAQKLNATALVQTKIQGTDGKVIGDIYVKNLTDPNLPVIRVKDASMTNGGDIKQLLSTVQITSSSSSSSSTGQ